MVKHERGKGNTVKMGECRGKLGKNGVGWLQSSFVWGGEVGNKVGNRANLGEETKYWEVN